MYNKIIFNFKRDGQEIKLDGTEYGILDYEGLEATDYDIRTERNINYSGARIKKKSILPRPVMVEFEYRGRNREEKRQELIAFFSPFRSGVLQVDYQGFKRQIEYEVESLKFKSKNLYEPLTCLLELTCMDPDFRDILQTGEKISTWIRGWKWKFTLPFKMKERGEPQRNIINSGHVETPIEIEFHGPAVNPRIINLTTGEFIRIKRELTSDDTLYINTAFGNKKVEIIRNGVREDAFDYIDLESVFFSLQVGDNVIEYNSENGFHPQSVEIYYYNRYIGV